MRLRLRPKAGLALMLVMVIPIMIGCKSRGESDFEGVINMKMNVDCSGHGREGRGEPESKDACATQMFYYFKKHRMRTEIIVGLGDNAEVNDVTIEDLPSARVTALLTDYKEYVTMDPNEMAADRPGKDWKFPKLTRTGKKETIAGYSCEHYLIGDEQDVGICVAKGLGYLGRSESISLMNVIFSEKMKAGAAANPEWTKVLEGGAFPLKIGEVYEVTSIERKKLDDSLFAVPADYKEMKMPAGIPAMPARRASNSRNRL